MDIVRELKFTSEHMYASVLKWKATQREILSNNSILENADRKNLYGQVRTIIKKEIFPALKYFSRLFSKNIQNGAEVVHNAQTDQNSAANGWINVHQLKVKVKKRTVPVFLWVLEFGLSGQIGLAVLLLTLMLVAIPERPGSNNYLKKQSIELYWPKFSEFSYGFLTWIINWSI